MRGNSIYPDGRRLEEYRDVWVYLERDGASGRLSQESLGLIAAGRKVADKARQSLVGILFGEGLGSLPEEAIGHGADSVITVDDPGLADYFSLRILDALYPLVKERKPYALIFLADETGKDIAPRLAYRVKTGLATDNMDFEVDDYFNPKLNESFKNLLIQIRPDFGIRIARIYTPRTRPQMATLKPGNFAAPVPDPKRSGRVERLGLPVPEKRYPASVRDLRYDPGLDQRLETAHVIISLGMGILRDKSGRARDPAEAHRLAMRLKELIERRTGLSVEIGASRALVRARIKGLQDLISEKNEIGLTGATVAPKLYISLGISGAIQHEVGMSKAKKIVAVNLDPNAPIFEIAHYPVIEDVYDFLPRMIDFLEDGADKGGGTGTIGS